MAKDRQAVSVKEAVYKIQLSLFEGIRDETQLFAAGSLMSRADYGDVVTERSIANICGYPLCGNPLPNERPWKGRYRISLKEHKVYDLHETYMYCSPSCVVNSRAFAGTLEEERTSVLNQAKIDEILRRFEDLSLEAKEEGLGKDEDLGLSGLMIQENTETRKGDVSLEEWIGPSNAIEGYVPQGDRSSKPLNSRKSNAGSKSKHSKPNTNNTFVFNEMDFTSCIVTGDEYSISKAPSGPTGTASASNTKLIEDKGKMSAESVNHQFCILEISDFASQNDVKKHLKESKQERNQILSRDEPGHTEVSSTGSSRNPTETKVESHIKNVASKSMHKSSLKSSGSKKLTRSVTWADERVDSMGSRNLCEVREMEDKKQAPENIGSMGVVDVDGNVDMLRFASAEACAIALQQAADAVASGEADVTDAVSEAGIIVLPPHNENEIEAGEDDDVVEQEPAPIKWPKKLANSDSDMFDPEDSWYDAPPEGFNLTLSPFATIWMAIFAWISSSSLAYIYGRDESFHEDYLTVNGREYPQKIVLSDGRSTEIKQTLAGYLSRALPGLASELRIRTPISTLEQAMGRLLDTMSFLDPLPSLRMKQWQVVTLLFIDAISVCRIPAATPDMTSRRMLLHKVLDGAQVGLEEYEVMKDFIIPLGRAPQFCAQSGG